MRLKGKNSGAVVRLREIINFVQWVSRWLSFIAAGYEWFFITHIYWKQKSHNLTVHILSPFLFSYVTVLIIMLHAISLFSLTIWRDIGGKCDAVNRIYFCRMKALSCMVECNL